MKKLIAVILTAALFLICGVAVAENGSADITFENTIYHLTYESAEVTDGALSVRVGGYGSRMSMRNGSIVIVARALAVVDGVTMHASSVTADSSGIYTFEFETDQLPEAVMIAPYEDEDNPVTLWTAADGDETSGEAVGDTEGSAETGVPADLVGKWTGIGTPKNGGTSIDLNVTVGEDGSGEYTFGQGSYFESYPFTVFAEDNMFSVDIPATSTLGSVSGTWELKDGKLYLDITSVFTNGGSYSYTAECVKATEEEADTAKADAAEEDLAEEDTTEKNAVETADAEADALSNELLDRWNRLESGEFPTEEGDPIYAGKLLIAVKNYGDPSIIEKEEDSSWRGIPAELLADSFDDADTLIFITAERTTVGFYTTGGSAQKTTTKIYAVDLHSEKAMEALTVAVNNPPSTITVTTINGVAVSGGASGEFELDTAAEKILELHTEFVEPTPEPAPEPTEVPESENGNAAETPESDENTAAYVSGEDAEYFLSVLDNDVYRDTYAALLGGETIQKGSKGDTARGVQQTLIALGQNISADGSAGSKTLGALNNVRETFGAPESETLGAEDYAELLKWLVFATDEDAALGWMTDENEDEYLYLRACVLALNEYYYHAEQLFEECEWADSAERAQNCTQEMPNSGEIWRSSSFTGKKSSLTFKVNSTSEDTGSIFKIYNEEEELLSCVFVKGGGSAKVKLSGGTYIIKMGTGTQWYGVGDSFGEHGWYETMLFDDGNDRVTLSSGYSYTLTINTTGTNGDSVGSEDEEWSDF